MDYVDYLGYHYRLIEFDGSVEAFDDFFTGKEISIWRSCDLHYIQVTVLHSWL